MGGTEERRTPRGGGGRRFDVLLTTDKRMRYQQNVATLPMSVVILDAPCNQRADLIPLVPKVLELLRSLPPKTFVEVRA